MLQTKMLILLCVCLAGVKSLQDSVEHSHENTECLGEMPEENFDDNREAVCTKSAKIRDKEECSASEGTNVDDTDNGILDEEDDQSDLSMLEEEDLKFTREDNSISEECPQHTPEKDSCGLVDSSPNLIKEENLDSISESGDVSSNSLVENGTQLDDRKKDEKIDVSNSNEDLLVRVGDPNEETRNLEPEQENVPLREILLKLKPEGLTDDEDEQSDYPSEMEDESEVEEEALVSSGSPEKQEQNLDTNGTKGSTDVNSSSSSGGSKKAVCSETNVTEPITDVEILNATALLKLLQVDPNVTSRSTSGPCYLVYFFSPYCPFSVMGSPYVNALARSVPNIPTYGLDSIEYHSVNARYGVMGTPTLLLFHNGNGVGRYNASEYSVSQLMSFIRHYTDQELTDINVTSSDFRAKLPAQLAEARPYALWAAWIFLLSFASWLFLTSELYARLTEAVLNNWREAEAQNDHQD